MVSDCTTTLGPAQRKVSQIAIAFLPLVRVNHECSVLTWDMPQDGVFQNSKTHRGGDGEDLVARREVSSTVEVEMMSQRKRPREERGVPWVLWYYHAP